jgi:hypothetical protein
LSATLITGWESTTLDIIEQLANEQVTADLPRYTLGKGTFVRSASANNRLYWVDLFVVRGCMSRLDWQLAASPTSIDESGTDYLYCGSSAAHHNGLSPAKRNFANG